jgi:hypothetical protein
VLDGVLVTDLSYGGLSTLYYDFDQFETVSVTTGTNDPRVGLGGIDSTCRPDGARATRGAARCVIC